MMPWMDTLAARLKFAREKRGLSQPALAGLVKITFQSIQAIENGGGTKHLNAIARALNVRLDWLEDGLGEMELSNEQNKPHPDSSLDEVKMIGPTPGRDISDTIPLRAARGGDDMEMFVEDDPIDYHPRPPVLAGVSGAYSMWVSGNSMVPIVRPGCTLHVNPNVRPQPGEIVIVWKRNKAILVKEYVRRSSDLLTLKEYSGTVEGTTFTVPLADTLAVHKVVGMDFG